MFSLLPNYGFKFIFTYWPRLSGSTSYIRNPYALRNQMQTNVHHLHHPHQINKKQFLWFTFGPKISVRNSRVWSRDILTWTFSLAYLDSFRIRSVLKIRTIRRNKASSTRTWSDKSVFISVSKTFIGSFFWVRHRWCLRHLKLVDVALSIIWTRS